MSLSRLWFLFVSLFALLSVSACESVRKTWESIPGTASFAYVLVPHNASERMHRVSGTSTFIEETDSSEDLYKQTMHYLVSSLSIDKPIALSVASFYEKRLRRARDIVWDVVNDYASRRYNSFLSILHGSAKKPFSPRVQKAIMEDLVRVLGPRKLGLDASIDPALLKAEIPRWISENTPEKALFEPYIDDSARDTAARFFHKNVAGDWNSIEELDAAIEAHKRRVMGLPLIWASGTGIFSALGEAGEEPGSGAVGVLGATNNELASGVFDCHVRTWATFWVDAIFFPSKPEGSDGEIEEIPCSAAPQTSFAGIHEKQQEYEQWPQDFLSKALQRNREKTIEWLSTSTGAGYDLSDMSEVGVMDPEHEGWDYFDAEMPSWIEISATRMDFTKKYLKVLAEKLKSLKIGSVSEPIDSPDGYYVLYRTG